MLSMETLALARAYADKIKQQVGAGFTPQIVESLPTVGDATILYLVLKEGTAPQGNIYDEYLWINGAYEHIGDTATLMTVDNTLSATSENPVQNKVIKGELDKKIDEPSTNGLVRKYMSGVYSTMGVDLFFPETPSDNNVPTTKLVADQLKNPLKLDDKDLQKSGIIKQNFMPSNSTTEGTGTTSYMILQYDVTTLDSTATGMAKIPSSRAVGKYVANEIVNKVDKVEGKQLSTNDYTNAEKVEVAKIVNKADTYDVKRVTSNNYFNTSTAIMEKALNTDGTIIDYVTGVLSDKIPVKGKYVVCSMSEATTGTTAYRIAGYKIIDGVETFVAGTYNISEPKIAYTTKSGQTRYRTASEIDYSSCEYIRISTTTTNVAKSYMIGFTDKNLSAYDDDYDEYAETLDKYLSDNIKVKEAAMAIEAVENNNAKHLSIYKAMSQFVLSDKTLKIKLLGDSITEGYGGTGFTQSSNIGVETNTNGVCWANMLREYMTTKFDCTFINFGSSGMNSQTMYNNIFVTPNLIDGSEDVVIIMIGTNDRKTNTKATFYSNLKAIIEKIQANGTKVVIMSSIPSSAEEEAITTNAYHMDDVDNIIMKVATDLNVEYISLYKKMNEYLDLKGEELSTYLNSDGLHPNDNGYTLIFKLMLSALGFGQKYRVAT